MNKQTIMGFLLLLSLFIGCSPSEPNVESEGQRKLKRARIALSECRYTEARSMIDSLRTHCRTAFEAREQGILLLDSINIAEAVKNMETARELMYLRKNSIDSLLVEYEEAESKVLFYNKKLEHDIKSRNK